MTIAPRSLRSEHHRGMDWPFSDHDTLDHPSKSSSRLGQEPVMPIEVHCPNPQCAKVHLVKDKYAGMRGKCPACSAWMYIPKTAAPTMIVPRPEALEEAAWKSMETTAPARETPARANRKDSNVPEETLPVVKREERVRPEPRIEARQDEDESAVTVQPDMEKPKRSFNWMAALLLLLGMLSFGAIAATPFLEAGKVNATGDFEQRYTHRKLIGVKEDLHLYVMAVPAGGATLLFLALVAGFIGRRFGFLSLFLVYMAGLLAAGLLFLVVVIFKDQCKEAAGIKKSVEVAKSKGKQGDVDPSLGQYLWAGLGGAAGACLSTLLAAILMHRRWWGRVFAFFLLGGVASLGVVWVYHDALGLKWLDQYLPSLPTL
jgi:hypothetical protein